MQGSIFISYRRGDGPGFAGRLYDRLEQEFSAERVFLDVDNIAPGLDFVEVLHNKVAACDVLLAVIGRTWADARDGNGELRLHNPDDFVRIEIEQALNQGKRVIPVLVDGAEMPPRKSVPESLHPLLRRNAVRLTHEGFRSDVERLVTALEEALADMRKAPKPMPGPEAAKARGIGSAVGDMFDDMFSGKRSGSAADRLREALAADAADKAKPAPDRSPERAVGTSAVAEAAKPAADAASVDTKPLVDPGKPIGAGGLPRRSLILGGLGVGAAAVYLTRGTWLPFIDPPRTVTQSIILSGHTEPVTSGDFDPAADFVVTASLDGTARIWHTGRGAFTMALHGHEAGISSVAYSPTGRAGDLLTASDDQTARVWKLAPDRPFTLPPLVRILADHSAPVRAAWAPDGSRVVTGGGNAARIWDPADGKLLALCEGHELPVAGIAYSAAGVFFATTSEDKTARVWQAGNGSLAGVLAGHAAVVVSADFSPASNKIVTASWDATARLWGLPPAGPAEQVFQHEKGVASARFSPDSSRIVTACLDGNAWLWERSSVAGTALRGHEARLNSAVFSPDGKLILTAASDDTARLWNGVTGEALAVFVGHGNTVRGARFSPDGRRILTWSDDRTARLWAIPNDLIPKA